MPNARTLFVFLEFKMLFVSLYDFEDRIYFYLKGKKERERDKKNDF